MDLKADEKKWESIFTLRILLFMQYVGIINVTILPDSAIHEGVFGYILILLVLFVLLGTPLAYMESIVGQFTERDCIDVWKIRPCLSHVGYILIGWQFSMLIFNHTITSFLLHYFLISFEKPIPYLICGNRSDRTCNMLLNNFTINQECAQTSDVEPQYCEKLYRTFPEYQYWRYHMLNANNNDKFHVAWRVCLDSAIICFVVHFICFKREKSLKYLLPFVCIIPIVGMLILFLGSMRQRGILEKFENAIDLNFVIFSKEFFLSHMIQRVIQNLGIGTGLTFNLTSSSPFRTTCFTNCVLGVSLCALFSIISIISITMMSCPYAYQYNETLETIFKSPLFLAFERFPRFLNLYNHKQFYLILTFGILSILGIGSNILVYFNLLEIMLKRSPKCRLYPGLTCLIGCVILFITTIPLLSYHGFRIMAHTFRRQFTLIPTFVALLESLVFVLWYGIHRFSEDVHFMLGIQPNMWMKFTWLLANAILCYVLFKELLYEFKYSITSRLTLYLNTAIILLILIGVLVHVIVALFKRNFWKAFVLDPQWGPRNEVLQRSRGMFSAQAMTKEYMYRQYHLQAGILARQKESNIRV